jgi:AraC family transcriptional regulator, exoenzyme S synthesis regulatory protein ExsA
MRRIKLNFQFPFFEGKSADKTSKVSITDKLKLFDFGSNYAYFLILSEHNKDINTLVDTLKGTVEGDYCLLDIIYEKVAPFHIGISIDWLSKQVGYPSDLENMINNVLTNWNQEYSLFASRYFAFHKEYQRVSNQDLLIKSYFLQFIYFLVDDLLTEIAGNSATNFKSIELQKIKEIEEKITCDFHKATPSINEMAKMAGMSVSKFKNLFYELFETSPHQHILDKKMAYAKGLLQTGKYSITQVAYKVGYHHPSGFTRIYRQKFNHSPNTTYLKKL